MTSTRRSDEPGVSVGSDAPRYPTGFGAGPVAPITQTLRASAVLDAGQRHKPSNSPGAKQCPYRIPPARRAASPGGRAAAAAASRGDVARPGVAAGRAGSRARAAGRPPHRRRREGRPDRLRDHAGEQRASSPATTWPTGPNGTAYVGWIGDNGSGRKVSLCTLPRGAKALRGRDADDRLGARRHRRVDRRRAAGARQQVEPGDPGVDALHGGVGERPGGRRDRGRHVAGRREALGREGCLGRAELREAARRGARAGRQDLDGGPRRGRRRHAPDHPRPGHRVRRRSRAALPAGPAPSSRSTAAAR